MMQIESYNLSKEIWDKRLAKLQPHTFLQSWEWGEFHEALGYKIWHLPELVLVIKIVARRGTYLLVPHMVVPMSVLIFDKLKTIAVEENCDFIRICPLMPDTIENRMLFTNLKFKNAPIHAHTELSWVLDIEPSEDELLQAMRKTTRYSIRKAETDGVAIRTSDKLEDIELFWELHLATVNRHGFVPFSKEFIAKEFKVFQKYGNALLLFAYVQGKVTSSAMIIFANGTASYHHGASYAEHPTASYLLQWHAIREARRRGCRWYNFWGISPPDKPNHPWAGLTRFKQGFGGESEEYVHAQDLPLTPRYWITYIVETIRKRIRHL